MIRQSKATKRNFLTGEAIEIIKEKPIKGVRGVHTIELFDALTGKLVERVESENFISKVMEELQRQAALFAFLTDSMSGESSIQYNGPRYDLARYDVVFQNFDMSWVTRGDFPMSWIVLTDYDGPEDPENEIIMRGRIIGYADRYNTYVGSDTKRGTLNTAESFIEPQHIHLVYDWPTHAANGTFQSVYWNYDYDKNASFAVIGKKSLQISAPNGYLFVGYVQAKAKNGKLYFMGKEAQTNKVAILVYELNIQARTITNGQVYALLNTTSGYENFEIAPNGDIYLISESTLYCFGQNGSPKNIPGTSQTSRSYSGFLLDLFAIAGQDVYIESRTKYSNDLQINRYNINDLVNPLDVKVIPWASVDVYQKYCRGVDYIPDVDMLAITVDGYTYFVDRTMLDLSKNTPVKTSVSNYSAITYDPTKKQFIEIRHATPYENGQYDYTKRDVTIRPLGFIGARNLLPSPVTKTSTNTMKLTYDLYIDSF
ncbi:hypothetical protein HPJ93_05350 [Anoxybacillus flavithermus]|uniref:hypothetical protein n=1 Tax=Anoxybacillus flavithermus TaxID=33934 RepID=UPI001866239A|nr:hypothetical protein [Anoxybacillus flavithermus]MBE2905861.1 hypothetical protein [Anoxybacillus flavithermus]MBE2921276.1 hypothetical protein [Anoxybacillus flavithermus]